MIPFFDFLTHAGAHTHTHDPALRHTLHAMCVHEAAHLVAGREMGLPAILCVVFMFRGEMLGRTIPSLKSAFLGLREREALAIVVYSGIEAEIKFAGDCRISRADQNLLAGTGRTPALLQCDRDAARALIGKHWPEIIAVSNELAAKGYFLPA